MKKSTVYHGILYALSLAVLLPLAYGWCLLAGLLKMACLSFLPTGELGESVITFEAQLFLPAVAVGLVLCAALLLWKRWRYLPPALVLVCTLLWVVLPGVSTSILLGLGFAGVLCSVPALKCLLQAGLVRLSAIAPQTGTV